MMLTGVKEEGQASTTNNANLLVVATLPGLVARYNYATSPGEVSLKDLNTPTSRGCNM